MRPLYLETGALDFLSRHLLVYVVYRVVHA